MEFFTEAFHVHMDRNRTFPEDYESENENFYFDDDNFDVESSVDLITEEKAFVCDYDTIYACLYEELEAYRSSKQAKKKNMSSNWNNLLVVLPSGGITSMKSAPNAVLKDVRKFQIDSKLEKIKESLPVTIYNNNNVTPILSLPPQVPEVKVPEPKKVEKLCKKKLKKQKQKEKRKGEKKEKKKEAKEKEPEERNRDEENEELVEMSLDNKSRSESKAESLESAQNEVDDQESEENNETAIDIDLLDEIPAFISNALKKREKILVKKEEKLVKTSNVTKTNKKPVAKKPVLKPPPVKEILIDEKQPLKAKPTAVIQSTFAEQLNVDSEIDFTIKRIKPSKISTNEYLEAIALGKVAFNLIMSDQISQAIQFLTEAIYLNIYDLRHSLNRSFCYLRLGEYNLALKDAQIVSKYTNERDEYIKAKFRAGQALCGLKNLEESEQYLDEAYNFSQADPHIHRELMRVRILQLLYMGFRERDILEAFKECLSISEIIVILTERTIASEDDDYGYGSECDEDDIYNSDDEENPSFTRMLSNILKYQPGVSKKINLVPPNPLKFKMSTQQRPSVSYRKVPVTTEVKKIITTIPPKIPITNIGINDKAVWVGNTSPEITENMLRKRFARFGKIISIYRKPNENYTFVNFENAKSVTELLSSVSVIEVDGHKLPINAATRAK